MTHRTLVLTVLLAAVALAAPAFAADEADGGGFELPWDLSLSVGTDLSFSAGRLRPGLPSTEEDESILNSWSFGVGKGFDNGMSVGVNWGFYKYLSTAGGMNLQREARINDLGFSWSSGTIYEIPATGIRISGGLSMVAPLSVMSRTSTLRTSVTPRLMLSRSFGAFSIRAFTGGTKLFHRYTSPVVDPTQVDALRRQGGSEDLSNNAVAAAGVNAEWAWSSGLGVSYIWFRGFSTSLSWSYSRSWGYDVTPSQCDEFSSIYARCDGRIARDSMMGSMSVDYQIIPNLGVSLSATTAQRPKTSDNARINFPFWDLNTPGLFYTTISFGIAASL